jgi:predicted helicase
LNEENTIFGVTAAVGIAVMLLIKVDSKKIKNCQINYSHPCDIRATRKEKFDWISGLKSFDDIVFERITPDKNNNWINLSDNDFETLIPVIDKKENKTLFNEFSNGINTARDQWVYDFDLKNLKKKVQFFETTFNNATESNSLIKWSRDLKLKLKRGLKIKQKDIDYTISSYRPFIKTNLALNNIIVDVISLNRDFFRKDNKTICINVNGLDLRFLATNIYPDWHYIGDTKCLPLYRYNENGERIENITDWGLEQFVNHYKDKKKKITKEAIFHYTYAVLHNTAYRKKYELNLKREFPRIPFYNDFWKWSNWGKELIDLHINYETAKPFPLKQQDYEVKAEAKRQKEVFTKAEEPEVMFGKKPRIKAKLKADKQAGIIEIDELTFLSGVPKEAYDYKLGNRSALEWILDQYKEKKPTDPTIAAQFNTYRFEDYKEQVIELLKKVCTVSVETMKIIKKMENEKE